MKWLVFEALCLLQCLNICSQDILPEDGQVYGRDPLLFNGDKYTFFVPASTQGHQFLQTQSFSPGIVKIDGALFSVTKINYDIFNQQVVLEYVNEAGASGMIQLTQAWLQSFRMGDRRFELTVMPGDARKICQVIGDGDLRIYFYWYKTLSLDVATGSRNYVFSSPKKDCFLEVKGNLTGYHSNKSFLSVFEEDMRPPIRKYMKSQHINVKKASDRSLTELLNYCAAMLK